MTFVLVFGAVWLIAKLLSGTLRVGFWFSVLAAIICMATAPLIGFGAGAIIHASGIGGDVVRPGEHLIVGAQSGLLAVLAAPILVAYYRRKTTAATGPHATTVERELPAAIKHYAQIADVSWAVHPANVGKVQMVTISPFGRERTGVRMSEF